MSEASTVAIMSHENTISKWRAYVELTKPRITMMVLITVGVAAYVAAPEGSNLVRILNAMIGTFLIAASGSAFNQYIERYTDSMMKRTAKRPLPSEKLSANEVATFGAITFGCGLSYLFLQVSVLAAILGLATWVLYVLVYTPMKVRTWTNTIVGAVAGAMPILMGAAGSSETINTQSWLFFAVLFFWQFPHFMAIAWLYRHEYKKSGLVMLTSTEPTGIAAGRLAVGTAIVMYAVCLPLGFAMQGSSQIMFYVASTALCTLYLISSVRFLLERSDLTARKLLRASIIFLPLFMIALCCFT